MARRAMAPIPPQPTAEERDLALLGHRRLRNRTQRTTGPTHISSTISDLQAHIQEIRAPTRVAREAEKVIFLANGGLCFECQDTGPCSACDRGMEVARVERADFVARRHAELMAGAHLTPRAAAFTLATYPNKQSEAFQQILDFLSDWNGHEGLFLAGLYGRGKTGLLAGVLKEIALRFVDTTHRLRFITGTDLMDELRSAIDREHRAAHDPSIETYSALLDKVKFVRVLALDDLGTEKPTEFVLERLFSIINHRYEHELPTFVTTNLGLLDLAKRIDPRVFERLMETSRFIEVKGPNLREKKSKK